MKVALLGLPQAGKKTLFTLLTGREVSASRRPDEATEGTASIRDARVDRLAALCEPESVVYAENRFSLCPDVPFNDTARGWLDAARKCDLLCLVVRDFPSDQVYHPAGSVDPQRDIAYLEGEVLLADMAIIDKRLERLEKEKRAGLSSDQKVEEEALRKCMTVLEDGRKASEADLEAHECDAIQSLELVSFNPIVHVYNVSEDNLQADYGRDSMVISALIESEIMAIEDPAERQEFLEATGLTSSGLDRVNATIYDALGLMSFYTTGKDECRAWTIRKDSPAPIAGGKIHTDIQRGFIRVEVINYEDFVETGSEAAARDAGKLQTRGKDYIMQDGDTCHFLFNV
jgi:GTP-binding protein YchF